MTLAITGATGQLGRLAIAALQRRAPGARLVGLVRDPAKGSDPGIALRQADYSQPQTLGPALAGVETLVLISGSEVGARVAQHRAVIGAAMAAGVQRIIYTSILHADVTPIGLAAEHRETEAMLARSSLAVTLLRNGWYLENYTGALAPAIAAGALIGSSGTGRISAAARADYAEAIAVAATTSGHEGRTCELAGDVAFTMAELAAEVSRQTGKAIPYNDLPPDVYAGILRSVGLPGGMADAIADADRHAAGGALFDGGGALSALIGRPTTPLPAVVRAALAAQAVNA